MSHTNSTTNYGLPEFLSSDKPAWMADINTAFATIDTEMKANADSASQANTDIGTMGLNMAPGYSNASTYSVGDIVMYNKRVYICDIAVTVPEEFDSAKWSYYRMSDIGETANEDHELIGNTDISSVGDGTLTGAVSTLNANLSANVITVTPQADVVFNGQAIQVGNTVFCTGYWESANGIVGNATIVKLDITKSTNDYGAGFRYGSDGVLKSGDYRIGSSGGVSQLGSGGTMYGGSFSFVFAI